MDAKHTLGPWKVWRERKIEGTTSYTIVGDESGWPVSFVPGPVDTPDALLIAAAPDLLAALTEILPFAEAGVQHINSQLVGQLYPSINASRLDAARAAIAKATGEVSQ